MRHDRVDNLPVDEFIANLSDSELFDFIVKCIMEMKNRHEEVMFLHEGMNLKQLI